jgi:hypothetical protein
MLKAGLVVNGPVTSGASSSYGAFSLTPDDGNPRPVSEMLRFELTKDDRQFQNNSHISC